MNIVQYTLLTPCKYHMDNMFSKEFLALIQPSATTSLTNFQCTCSSTVCHHNNLQILYPNLCREYDSEKNSHYPSYYLPTSTQVVWWKCRNSCSCHRWEAKISSRVKGNNNCPFCKQGNLCLHSDLTLSHPFLCNEWNHEKNNTTPDKYTRGSSDVIWWLCSNNHIWQAAINQRIHHKLKCPHC
jgi:hypothetical protein